jgi:hypothetical protein
MIIETLERDGEIWLQQNSVTMDSWNKWTIWDPYFLGTSFHVLTAL